MRNRLQRPGIPTASGGNAVYVKPNTIVLAAAIPLFGLCLFAMFQIFMRFYVELPDNGTLGAGVVEAHRFALGMPVYEDPTLGHPAWIYGPGVLVVAGALFKLFGPSVILMRTGSLLATIGTIALGMAVVQRWLPRFWAAVALASFVAIDCRAAYTPKMA